MVQPAVRKANLAALDDAELVRRALDRDADAFATIMQRHNQRLYRIARSVLRNSADAEDAVQEAYVAAFSHPHPIAVNHRSPAGLPASS